MIATDLSHPLHHSNMFELMLLLFASATVTGMFIGLAIPWPASEIPACASAITGWQALPWLIDVAACNHPTPGSQSSAIWAQAG